MTHHRGCCCAPAANPTCWRWVPCGNNPDMCLDCGEEQLVDTVPGQVLIGGEWKAEGQVRVDQHDDVIVTGKIYKAAFLAPECAQSGSDAVREEICGYFEEAGQQTTQTSPCPWPFLELHPKDENQTNYTCETCQDRVDECNDCDFYCDDDSKFWPRYIATVVPTLTYESTTETGDCNTLQSDCSTASYCNDGLLAWAKRSISSVNFDPLGNSSFDGKIPCKADLASCPADGTPCSPFGYCDGRTDGAGGCVQDSNRPAQKLNNNYNSLIRNIEQVRSIGRVYLLELDEANSTEERAVYYPNIGASSEVDKMRVAGGWQIETMRGQAIYTCSKGCRDANGNLICNPIDPTGCAGGSAPTDCRILNACNLTPTESIRTSSAYLRLIFSCDRFTGGNYPEFSVKSTFWSGDDWDPDYACNLPCEYGPPPDLGGVCCENSSTSVSNVPLVGPPPPGSLFPGPCSPGSNPDAFSTKYKLHLRTSDHFERNGFRCPYPIGDEGQDILEKDCVDAGFPEIPIFGTMCAMENKALGTACYPTLLRELTPSMTLNGTTPNCGYSQLYSYAAYGHAVHSPSRAGFIYAYDGATETWKSQDMINASPSTHGCAKDHSMSGGQISFIVAD